MREARASFVALPGALQHKILHDAFTDSDVAPNLVEGTLELSSALSRRDRLLRLAEEFLQVAAEADVDTHPRLLAGALRLASEYVVEIDRVQDEIAQLRHETARMRSLFVFLSAADVRYRRTGEVFCEACGPQSAGAACEPQGAGADCEPQSAGAACWESMKCGTSGTLASSDGRGCSTT